MNTCSFEVVVFARLIVIHPIYVRLIVIHPLYVRLTVEVNLTLEQAMKAQRETHSLTSTLSGWSTPRLGRFVPGEQTQYPLYRRLGGSQDRSGRVRNTSPLLGLDPQTFQTVASCCTDCAMPAHLTEEK